jgi:hypothetical protein
MNIGRPECIRGPDPRPRRTSDGLAKRLNFDCDFVFGTASRLALFMLREESREIAKCVLPHLQFD